MAGEVQPDGAIATQVRAFIAQNFYVPEGDDLPADASLIERGIVDSTGVLELVAFLEREFHLKVEDRELLPENLETVARICAYVQRKKDRARPAVARAG